MTDNTQTTINEPAVDEKPTEAKAPAIDRDYPEVVPGVTVAVHQEITDVNSKGEEKKRIQIFEGMVLCRKHGKGNQATITVRKESDGVGCERIFPLYLPTLKKIVVLKRFRVRRAKLNYTRKAHKRLKEIK